METENAFEAQLLTFADQKKVEDLINSISEIPVEIDKNKFEQFERIYEEFIYVIDIYQSQPNLLDPYLDSFLKSLLEIVNQSTNLSLKFHLAFKFIYHLIKIRGFKTVVNHFPHEVSDLESVLKLCENEDSKDTSNWQTRYVLLLWLSIVVMIPFNLGRFDTSEDEKNVLIKRIYQIIQRYLVVGDKPRDAAAFLAARFLTRPEIRNIFLDDFIVNSMLFLEQAYHAESPEKLQSYVGTILALAYIFKIGDRSFTQVFAGRILNTFKSCDLQTSKHELIVKLTVKLKQRIGLTFLKPKVASWRYQRGNRSLLDNLKYNSTKNAANTVIEKTIEEDDEEVDSDIEDLLDSLLTALSNENTIVRWSAAKGIGRISNRLSKDYTEQIISSILELFSLRESDAAWHGGCLALAELARRGLILPSILPNVVAVIEKALIYDELKGSYYVGSHVRDAACYVCWSFARAFDPVILFPFVKQLASSLLNVSVFDREVNCRRAASAAFQEHVGRQGNFPNGIEIVTTVDYFAVGIRKRSFLELSVFLAQFESYSLSLIYHLVNHKVIHWDATIRELSANALCNLCPFISKSTLLDIFNQLSELTLNFDLNTRHGAILGLANIIYGLSKRGFEWQESQLERIKNIPKKIIEKGQFRGLGGEYMKHAVSILIKFISLSELPYHNNFDMLTLWNDILLETIFYIEPSIQEHGIEAIPAFYKEYYGKDVTRLKELVEYFINRLQDPQESVHTGVLRSLRKMSPVLKDIKEIPKFVIEELVQYIKDPIVVDKKFSVARSEALFCVNELLQTCVENELDVLVLKFYDCIFLCLEDYTQNNHGDIGRIVRSAAISVLNEFTLHLIKQESSVHLLNDKYSRKIASFLLPQCVSQQDKIREIAGQCFITLVVNLSNMPHKNEILRTFGEECKDENFQWKKESFSLFVTLLTYDCYVDDLWKGLVTSVGGLSESVFKDSRTALLSFLKSSNDQILSKILESFLNVFRNNCKDQRLALSLLNTTDFLLVSNVFQKTSTSYQTTLLELTRNTVFKSDDTSKLVAAVNILCGLLHFPSCCKTSLIYSTIYLCHRFAKVRSATASQLYIAIMTYSDSVLSNADNEEEILSTLSDTDWSSPVAELKPIRNKLCHLLNVPLPVPVKRN